MSRLFPGKYCVKSKCENKKILFLNPGISVTRVKKLLHSNIIQSNYYRRLGGSGVIKKDGGIQRHSNGDIHYKTGCNNVTGITYTPEQKVNNYGRYNGGSINNPRLGGLIISNFH
jgi:hypothetical protein